MKEGASHAEMKGRQNKVAKEGMPKSVFLLAAWDLHVREGRRHELVNGVDDDRDAM